MGTLAVAHTGCEISFASWFVSYQILHLIQDALDLIHDGIGTFLSQGGNQGTVVPNLVLPLGVEPVPEFLSQLPVVRQDGPDVVQLVGG